MHYPPPRIGFLPMGDKMARKPKAQETEKTVENSKKAQKTAKEARKTIQMLKIICRPEGTFQSGRRYELPAALSDMLIAAGAAVEV